MQNYPSRLGIVGGGQLGKMLAIAASQMGVQSTFIDPSAEAVAAQVSRQIRAEFNDETAIKSLFVESDAVTFEFENVSLQALNLPQFKDKLFPSCAALSVANDRIKEKKFFKECGLLTAPFLALTDVSELSDDDFCEIVTKGGEELGYPVILKTCSLGYDGKGQVTIKTPEIDENLRMKLSALKKSNRLVLEKRIAFQREVSVLAARGRAGEIVVYPTPTNVHREGILFTSTVVENEVIPELRQAAESILKKLDYVGLLAIEFFEIDGNYLANEMAPRVHNTGHWSIEGAQTSQFENHIRAVLGLPLGSTMLRQPTQMINIISQIPDLVSLAKIPGVHIHLYGKAARPGRKLGHITLEADSKYALEETSNLAMKAMHINSHS